VLSRRCDLNQITTIFIGLLRFMPIVAIVAIVAEMAEGSGGSVGAGGVVVAALGPECLGRGWFSGAIGQDDESVEA
jgi:hypothetical protein